MPAHARAFAIALATLLLGSCSLVGPPVSDVVPDGAMWLEVMNGTSMEVDLFVNGLKIHSVSSLSQDNVDPAKLPKLPWLAEIRHRASGRVLVRLSVRSGDVATVTTANGAGSQRGDGARVDLSCGRIDVWVGPPILGPAPGPGTPGDCDS